MKIGPNTFVEMHYELFTASGELLETTQEDGPVRYVHGDEEILPGLEAALEGHGAGDEVRVTLSAQDAYGDYNPEGLVSVPRQQFDDDADLEPDTWITVTVAESEETDEGELEMRVVEVREDEVILDANHPLAGQAVTFAVSVIAVAPGPPEDPEE